VAFFDVTATAYGRFMGRFSEPLGLHFLDLVGVRQGQRALDVGCGAGALTSALVTRLGSDAVTAVDPSEPFVDAVRERCPGVDVRLAPAEALPFAASTFDLALAQLVVHFMSDPVLGLREMARVAAPGGTVAANVWDHGGDRGPLSVFWQAARDLDPQAPDESDYAGVHDGDLARLFGLAGMTGATSTALEIEVAHTGLDDWWEPYTLGVGPAGAYVASLDPDARAALLARCAELLPSGSFSTRACAWTVVWTSPLG
jgi:SAM-dependent methyltransferase